MSKPKTVCVYLKYIRFISPLAYYWILMLQKRTDSNLVIPMWNSYLHNYDFIILKPHQTSILWWRGRQWNCWECWPGCWISAAGWKCPQCCNGEMSIKRAIRIGLGTTQSGSLPFRTRNCDYLFKRVIFDLKLSKAASPNNGSNW